MLLLPIERARVIVSLPNTVIIVAAYAAAAHHVVGTIVFDRRPCGPL